MRLLPPERLQIPLALLFIDRVLFLVFEQDSLPELPPLFLLLLTSEQVLQFLGSLFRCFVATFNASR